MKRHEYLPAVTYSQAHLRLKTDRGRADNYSCVRCQGQAQEWAYMGGCPNELIGLEKKYSLDQSRYDPMCVPCHRRHDRALADGRSTNVCPRGHEWNTANTGLRKKRGPGVGLRFCKACHRENSRAYHLRNIRGRQTAT
jgi:hypothetical protein